MRTDLLYFAGETLFTLINRLHQVSTHRAKYSSVFPLFCNEIRGAAVITDNLIEQLVLDKYPVPLCCDKKNKCAAHTQKTRSFLGHPSLFILLFFANSLSNMVNKYLCCGGSYCINTEDMITARKNVYKIQIQRDLWKL